MRHDITPEQVRAGIEAGRRARAAAFVGGLSALLGRGARSDTR